MMQKKSDDAVSPVVGVMLMIVITVVIAAVITTFATGVTSDAEAAPVAVLDVKIYDYYQALPDCGGPDFHISHISGDPIDTKDITIQLSWEHNGKSYFSTYSADSFKANYPTGVNGGGGVRMQPMYVKTPVTEDMRKEYGTGSFYDYYFGDVILESGMRLTATADFLTKDRPNTQSDYMDIIFNNGDIISTEKGIMDALPKDTAVQVTILHVPSNKAVYDKEVVVQ